MYILSIHSGGHDATAVVSSGQKILGAVQLERLTRIKGDGNRFPYEAIEEILTLSNLRFSDLDVCLFSRMGFPSRFYSHWPVPKKVEYAIRRVAGVERVKHLSSEMLRTGNCDELDLININKLRQHFGLRENCKIGFYNHHFAHALSALAYTDWNEAIMYTSDAGGDNVCWSHRLLKNCKIFDLYGSEKETLSPQAVDSLGWAYGFATMALGYKMARHEGKLTGLAAYGNPVLYDELSEHFFIDELGRCTTDFSSLKEMKKKIFSLAKKVNPADMAASIQLVLETKVVDSISKLVALHGIRKLAVAGGVFANVKLNSAIIGSGHLDDFFVFPGMGDEGLAVGGIHQWLIQETGLKTWLSDRQELKDVYWGRNYSEKIDLVLTANSSLSCIIGNPVNDAAKLLSHSMIGAVYVGRMEFGPRALGCRSILANPSNKDVNQTLNKRLNRTEFMPFAPYVLENDADDVFIIDRASKRGLRFMTITCPVRPEWRPKIPAVVHVDGTARPQIVNRDINPLYADILQSFKAETGLPVLINTSFNAHEEPIINSPYECEKALCDSRVDFIVTNRGIYFKNEVSGQVRQILK
jgi:carbamoyltransferase